MSCGPTSAAIRKGTVTETLTILFSAAGVVVATAGLMWTIARQIVGAFRSLQTELVEFRGEVKAEYLTLRGEVTTAAVEHAGIAELFNREVADIKGAITDHETRIRHLEQRP